MNFSKYLWAALYLLGALIQAIAHDEFLPASLITIFPVFIIGLVPALMIFLAFKRTQWTWYHVLNLATTVMVGSILVNVLLYTVFFQPV